MVKVACRKSKKGRVYTALVVNGVVVSYDLFTIMKVTGLSYDYIRSLKEGDEYEV